MSTDREIDAVHYKNGQKNNWRRTAWNVLAKVAMKDSPILYLPGSTDLDRPEAIRRGFKPANMIAIERDERVVRALRSKGVTTIHGDLNAVLSAWPAAVRIAAVVADFQGGLGAQTEALKKVMTYHPALANAVLLVNLMRGRDAVRNFRGFQDGFADLLLGDVTDSFAGGVLNRALLFATDLYCMATDEFVHMQLEGRAENAREIERASLRGRGIRAVLDRLAHMDEWDMRQPAVDLLRFKEEEARRSLKRREIKEAEVLVPLPSYRSTASSPIFDSAVMRFPGSNEFRVKSWRPIRSDPAIAAALALRTMRLRGDLGGGHWKLSY